MNDIRATCLHALLLLTERTEEVFHQSPIEECTKLINPSHLKVGKIAYHSLRLECGSHTALLIVEIDKHFHLIAYLKSFWHIAVW